MLKYAKWFLLIKLLLLVYSEWDLFCGFIVLANRITCILIFGLWATHHVHFDCIQSSIRFYSRIHCSYSNEQSTKEAAASRYSMRFCSHGREISRIFGQNHKSLHTWLQSNGINSSASKDYYALNVSVDASKRKICMQQIANGKPCQNVVPHENGRTCEQRIPSRVPKSADGNLKRPDFQQNIIVN